LWRRCVRAVDTNGSIRFAAGKLGLAAPAQRPGG
jgi:hypothetical protein